jgi:hypothetical protein
MELLREKTGDLGRFDGGSAVHIEERSFYAYRRRKRAGVLLCVSLLLLLVGNPWASSCRGADPKSSSSETIVELQQFRETRSIVIKGAGAEEGRATLINLNPNVNAWYLLQVKWQGGASAEVYHLENANPQTQKLLLDDNPPYGLVAADGKDRYICDLWGTTSRESLRKARASGAAYAPLCGGKVYLRNPVKGHRTGIEMVTDFLRDEVPAGEKIVAFVRDTFFKDLYREKAKLVEEAKPGPERQPQGKMENAPEPALIDPKQADRIVQPTNLGIQIQEPDPKGMVLGTWYAVRDNPGIYISLIVAEKIAPEILHSYKNVAGNLDSVEATALVYLVAFDLGRYELNFTLGTEHPRVNWSDHLLDRMKDKSLPGPDGIGGIAPLVSTGLINPTDAAQTVATFTGGFKRTHGAFKWGELALKNHGSHYGFMEDGVIFSTLQPGLSTIYGLNDGRLDMKTWTEKDNDLLPRIKYARQNGVPIIAGFDPVAHMSVPGSFISRWGEGNWSGSVDEKLRTLRSGAALQESEGKRFLIYAVFTSATPSAMARVFQAYRCRYAMLLDMNALEHTYLAIYRRQGANLYVQHLIQGMSEVDRSVKGQYIPRFLGYSDDRDFFYLTRKKAP